MMLVPAGIKVHMAVGYTDLRKGLDGLAVLVEQVLEKDPCLCSAAGVPT
jgi:transposase